MSVALFFRVALQLYDIGVNAAAGHENVVSKANGGVWGNIILGGGIGYIVDRNSGAGFDYPNSITVFLHKVGEVIGVTTPSTQAAIPVPSEDVVAVPMSQTDAK